MGMDSVEIVRCWEESLAVMVDDEFASQLNTPAESIALLSTLVKVRSGNDFCLNQRAFYRIRNILINEFNVPRHKIKPSTRLSMVFPKKGQRKSWRKFKQALDFKYLSSTIGLPLLGAGNTKIEDVVTEIVARKSFCLIDPHQGWTISQIRDVVRASVRYVVGVKEFSDNDHYINDIGID